MDIPNSSFVIPRRLTENLSRLNYFRSEKLDIDIILQGMPSKYKKEGADEKINAHKIILALNSTYFEKLLSSKRNQKVLHCSIEIPSNILKELVSFMYGGAYPSITKDNILDLLSAAHLLEIDEIMERCQEFISNNMTIQALSIPHMLSKNLPSKTVASVTQILVANFEQFSSRGQFQLITLYQLEQLIEILSAPTTHWTPAESLLKLILNWVLADVLERQKHLIPLLQNVPLQNIPAVLMKESVMALNLNEYLKTPAVGVAPVASPAFRVLVEAPEEDEKSSSALRDPYLQLQLPSVPVIDNDSHKKSETIDLGGSSAEEDEEPVAQEDDEEPLGRRNFATHNSTRNYVDWLVDVAVRARKTQDPNAALNAVELLQAVRQMIDVHLGTKEAKARTRNDLSSLRFKFHCGSLTKIANSTIPGGQPLSFKTTAGIIRMRCNFCNADYSSNQFRDHVARDHSLTVIWFKCPISRKIAGGVTYPCLTKHMQKADVIYHMRRDHAKALEEDPSLWNKVINVEEVRYPEHAAATAPPREKAPSSAKTKVESMKSGPVTRTRSQRLSNSQLNVPTAPITAEKSRKKGEGKKRRRHGFSPTHEKDSDKTGKKPPLSLPSPTPSKVNDKSVPVTTSVSKVMESKTKPLTLAPPPPKVAEDDVILIESNDRKRKKKPRLERKPPSSVPEN